MNRRTAAAVGLLLLASLACTTLVGDGGQAPMVTVESSGETSGSLLMQDDFSDPSTGWEVGDYDTGSVGYRFDAYSVESNGGGSTMWGVANRTFSDTVVEVEAEQISAPANDNNDYGVMCRVQENNDGYFLLISGDGLFSILKRAEGSFEHLVQWTESDAIKQGNATNQIRATCDGSTLALAVNGQQLAAVEDTSFSSGDLALTTTSYEEESTTVYFDDLRVLEP